MRLRLAKMFDEIGRWHLRAAASWMALGNKLRGHPTSVAQLRAKWRRNYDDNVQRIEDRIASRWNRPKLEAREKRANDKT